MIPPHSERIARHGPLTMQVDKASSRIPLPPLKTQNLEGEGGDAAKIGNVELNLKITPLSVTTQHVYVDCTDEYYAESFVGEKHASTSPSNDGSVRSSIDRALSVSTGVGAEGIDGGDVATSLPGQTGGVSRSASGKSTAAGSLSAVNVVVRVRPVGAAEAGSSSVVSTVIQGDVHQVVLNDPVAMVQVRLRFKWTRRFRPLRRRPTCLASWAGRWWTTAWTVSTRPSSPMARPAPGRRIR